MDLNQVKLDDPGGTLESALVTLQSMTVEVLNSVTSNVLTQWAAMNNVIVALETDVSATQGISKAALTILQRGNGSINLSNAENMTMLNSLVTSGVITQAMLDDLITRATKTLIKYPGIHMGDIQNARAI